MCKILFPEYEKTWFHSIDDEHIVGHLINETNPHKLNLHIHWFEFCWIILNKLSQQIESPLYLTKEIEQFGLICFNKFESLHPVDYLYEIFKKLNK